MHEPKCETYFDLVGGKSDVPGSVDLSGTNEQEQRELLRPRAPAQ